MEFNLADIFKSLNIEEFLVIPGHPITPLDKYLTENNLNVTHSLNEKAAVEEAFGNSLAGRRSMVILKSVGLNIASDPIVNMIRHGTGAGMLIIVGDDVDAKSTTLPQDSRQYAQFFKTLFFEPTDFQVFPRFLEMSYKQSEILQVPIILRCQDQFIDKIVSTTFKNQPKSDSFLKPLDRKRTWTYSKYGRQQYLGRVIHPIFREIVSNEPFLMARAAKSRLGIIKVGYITGPELPDYDQLIIGSVFPLPEKKIIEFAQKHEKVIILEQGEPVVENELRSIVYNKQVQIIGKLTRHLPFSTTLKTEEIIAALEKKDINNVDRKTEIQLRKKESIKKECEGCEYVRLFEVLASLRKEFQDKISAISTDVGCSINLSYPPYEAVDAAVCLGSPIAVANGAASQKKSIAITGDYALMHTGLPSLIEASTRKKNALIIIMDNSIMSKTGGQTYNYNLHEFLPELAKNLKLKLEEINLGTEEDKQIIREKIIENLNNTNPSIIYCRFKCRRY